ncbi:MAG: beta-ketoacyl-[acyl-carrier-protein] synthase family protein [Alphaproteobacteria bacterium]|nr:beta-ketoacyl-[acyl-carrier-protein] synthase family protein [Alphaproteobacteria bacterium]
MRCRVVVTGVGAVHPLGLGVPALLDGLLAGRSAVGPITRFDPGELPTRIAAEAPDPPEAPLGDRRIGFALAAAAEAMAGDRPTGRGVVSMGVGLELFSMQDLARQRAGVPLPDDAEARLRFLQTPSDHVGHLLSVAHGCVLPPRVHVTACAAGADAIADAAHRIRVGRADWALCGGTDSMIHPLGVAGFCALQATSTRNAEPARASRPFDRRRDGFVMGEGAGVLRLEALDDALARGAPILGEVLGAGRALEAYKISDPSPEGRGALAAMRAALTDAGSRAEDVDAVNAHGTSTAANDGAEARALRALLGERRVPISATKSMIGHLIGAAGAVEAIVALGCMARGRVHATLNLEEPDPDALGLDLVAGGAREHAQRVVLSCSYGFGGHCTALVLGTSPS